MLEFSLETKYPVAYESLDHINPWGTKRDNSRNHLFNQKVYKIFDEAKGTLKIMDLGCSGGGFIKDCIDDGCIAIGLEGSDFSKKHKRAEWRTIPENLFTCDITKPFQVLVDNQSMKFDLITSWEVLEHIEEKDLPQLFKNIREHLSDEGLCIVSICHFDDYVNGVNLHRTVKEKSWWLEKVKELGFNHIDKFEDYFNGQFIRGNKFNSLGSFHLILTKNIERSPKVPTLTIKGRLFDLWHGSKTQRLLKTIIQGYY